MNIADCYRILGLRSGASLAEVKASYRQLARKYHPDVNPADRRSPEKFIQLHQAYQLLSTVLRATTDESGKYRPARQPTSTVKTGTGTVQTPKQAPSTNVTPQESQFRHNPNLSEFEKLLKQRAYVQLHQLLKHKRFPRAIALVEGLAQRIPQDVEVRQWQAITYQRWGRHLVNEGQLDKAKIYLKKALRTDPNNRALWAEVERDFRRMEHVI